LCPSPSDLGPASACIAPVERRRGGLAEFWSMRGTVTRGKRTMLAAPPRRAARL
jgi:hypothetical protein